MALARIILVKTNFELVILISNSNFKIRILYSASQEDFDQWHRDTVAKYYSSSTTSNQLCERAVADSKQVRCNFDRFLLVLKGRQQLSYETLKNKWL